MNIEIMIHGQIFNWKEITLWLKTALNCTYSHKKIKISAYRFYPVLPMGKTDHYTQFYPLLPNRFYPRSKFTMPTLATKGFKMALRWLTEWFMDMIHSVWHYDFYWYWSGTGGIDNDTDTMHSCLKLKVWVVMTLVVFSLMHKFNGPCISDSLKNVLKWDAAQRYTVPVSEDNWLMEWLHGTALLTPFIDRLMVFCICRAIPITEVNVKWKSSTILQNNIAKLTLILPYVITLTQP